MLMKLKPQEALAQRDPQGDRTTPAALPPLLKVPEVAQLLRTTPKAIYTMNDRGKLPGVVRLGRRLLVRTSVLVSWIQEKHATSPKEDW